MVVQVLNEGGGVGIFIVSEASGTRSREEGTLKQGENVLDGALLKWDAGKLVAVDNDDLDSEGSIENFAGLVIGNFDASSSGVNADWPHVPYLARDAEVNIDEMSLPEESTEGGEHALYRAFLATVGIICRDSGSN